MKRHARLIAITIVGLALAGSVADVWLSQRYTGWSRATTDAAAMAVFNLGFALVGAIILLRGTGNVVGWLCAIIGVCFALEAPARTYAEQVYATGATTALGVWSAWAATWLWLPAFTSAFLLLPLLFPDGRLPSRRWRPVLVFCLAAPALQWLGILFASGPMQPDQVALWSNPLGLSTLAGLLTLVDAFIEVAFIPLLIALIVAVALRYRRAGAEQRQQMKWFFFALLVVVSWFVFSITPLFDWVPEAAVSVTMLVFPASIAIAVLRYRLYEIDRIISRTVGYALITGVLVAVYAGVVLLLGGMLGSARSEVAVAASTLLVAALFTPVRRRVQTLVDHRFNRARYDAQRIVEDFTGRLRGAVAIEELHGELLDVIGRTVEPATAGLWLRGPR